MSSYVIEVDDNVVEEKIITILNQVVNRQLANKYSVTGDVVAGAVKEIIYSRKEEIIDKVVERSTREIVRKGLPTFLERICNEKKS